MNNLEMRHLKIANRLVNACLSNFRRVRSGGKRSLKSDRLVSLSGHLLMLSSVDIIRHVVDRVKVAKMLNLKQSSYLLSMIQNSASGVVTAMLAVIKDAKESKEKGDKLYLKKEFINSISNMTEVVDALYDLSESVMFRIYFGNKESKNYYVLQDTDLNKWSKDIIDYLDKNKMLIDHIIKSEDTDFSKLGRSLRRSSDRLRIHLNRIPKETVDLLSNKDMDMVTKVA